MLTVSMVHTSSNALFYSAATAIIRYTYIRSSLQSDIQAAIKRNAFVFKTIFIAEALGFLNLINFYLIQRGKSGTEKLSTISYQTCLDPFHSSIPINPMKVMPFTQYLLHLTTWCIIGFNLAIFKHLNKISSTNTTLSQMDQIKTRRRNLVSAKVGIYFLVIYLIAALIHCSLYVVSMEYGKLSFIRLGQILHKNFNCRISSLHSSDDVWCVLLYPGSPHCDVQFLSCDEQSKEDVFQCC